MKPYSLVSLILCCCIFCVLFLIQQSFHLPKVRMEGTLELNSDIESQEPIKFLTVSDFPLKKVKQEKYYMSFSEELKQYKEFTPALNSTEYEWYLELIGVFKRQCEAFNITYMIAGGSALGTYRHHGFIPWDDDFDVQVNVSQRQTLVTALYGVPGYSLDIKKDRQWKFYSNTFGMRTPHIWNWPFVDIFFFGENATHVFDITYKSPIDIYPRSAILPLQLQVFENLILPGPSDMGAYLNKEYKKIDYCKSNTWGHKRERRPKLHSIQIPCKVLSNVYALVHRFEIGGDSFEELQLGNKTLYRLMRPSVKK